MKQAPLLVSSRRKGPIEQRGVFQESSLQDSDPSKSERGVGP